jgi:hypothetical protein
MNDHYTKIQPVGFGMALGIIWGLGVALMALSSWFTNFGYEFVEFLGKLYIGYHHNAVGALIGFIWGFVDAFVFGWLIAALYNKLLSCPCCK